MRRVPKTLFKMKFFASSNLSGSTYIVHILDEPLNPGLTSPSNPALVHLSTQVSPVPSKLKQYFPAVGSAASSETLVSSMPSLITLRYAFVNLSKFLSIIYF